MSFFSSTFCFGFGTFCAYSFCLSLMEWALDFRVLKFEANENLLLYASIWNLLPKAGGALPRAEALSCSDDMILPCFSSFICIAILLYFCCYCAYNLAASAFFLASFHLSEPISAPRLLEASFFTFSWSS